MAFFLLLWKLLGLAVVGLFFLFLGASMFQSSYGEPENRADRFMGKLGRVFGSLFITAAVLLVLHGCTYLALHRDFLER